jgi:hypothetical protein
MRDLKHTTHSLLLACSLIMAFNVLLTATDLTLVVVNKRQPAKSRGDRATKPPDDTHWSVPVCGSASAGRQGKRIKARTSQFVIPTTLTIKKVQDSDYEEWVIFAKPARNAKASPDHLEVWYGPTSGASDAPTDLTKSTAVIGTPMDV